jgi:hemolysin activation/secretion protein
VLCSRYLTSSLLLGLTHLSLSAEEALISSYETQDRESEAVVKEEEALLCYHEKQDRKCEVLVKELKGIALFGSRKDRRRPPSLEQTQAIDWIGLDLPGRPQELRKQLRSYLGKPVTVETLRIIKRTITDYYIANHRPFVIVKVPAHEVTSGVLQLIVTESRLGKLTVEGNTWTSSERIKKYCQIEHGQPIDESRLIQNVSFINRNPFRRVDLVFVPGETEGTTDVIIATKDRRSARVYTGTDNTGVEPIGANRWYAGFNWGNAFNLDHILSYQYTASYNIHRFQAHIVEYTAPLSWGQLLNVYGGYSEVHPRVQAPFKRNDGWSMQTSARYVAPLKIYPYLEHEITGGGDFKRSNNTFEFTEQFPRIGNNVNLTQLVLGYSGNYERNALRLDFTGNLYWSPGKWIADQTNADYASLRPGAVNHWLYFRGSFVYLQRLPNFFSLSLLAAGQVSTQPLLPSEQFGLGGYDTVRGYEQREVNKDDSILLSAEARSPGLPLAKWIKPTCKIPDGLQFVIFLDYGWGINIDKIPGTDKTDYLIGAGPGIRYTLEPYLTLRLDWGIRLHNKKSFEGGWDRLHFNVTASY